MKKHIWLTLGALVLAACSQPTPPSTGELVKKGEEKTVTAGGDGELKIDKDKLANDAIVSIGKTTTPDAPTGVQGGFTALLVRSSGIAIRPQAVLRQEVNLPEIDCPSGFRLKIFYPAGTQNAAGLRMYNTTGEWKQLTPYRVNQQLNYVVGCMAQNALDPGTATVYTLGIPSTSLEASGGTVQDTIKTAQGLVPAMNTTIRMKYKGAKAPFGSGQNTGKVTITGPAGWNSGAAYTSMVAPDSSSFKLFSVDAPPVSGSYTMTYDDGVSQLSDSFNINAESVLPRATEVSVVAQEAANTFNFSWIKPEGAVEALQQSTVTLLQDLQNITLASAAGGSPRTLTIPGFNGSNVYAFCVYAYSASPTASSFDTQVNESRACTTYGGFTSR